MKCKIFYGTDLFSGLEDEINKWMKSIKLTPNKIIKIAQSECEDSTTITIFYDSEW